MALANRHGTALALFWSPAWLSVHYLPYWYCPVFICGWQMNIKPTVSTRV